MKPAKKAPERSFEPSLYVIKESPDGSLERLSLKKMAGSLIYTPCIVPVAKKTQVFKMFQQFRHTGYSPHMFKTGGRVTK